MKTVLFLGNVDTKIEDLPGLWLQGVKRDESGNIFRGHVINGVWDLRLTPKFLFAGSEYSDRPYVVVTKRKKPELIVEVQVEVESSYDDYNKVIYEASKVLKANKDKIVTTTGFNYIKINCDTSVVLKKKKKRTKFDSIPF